MQDILTSAEVRKSVAHHRLRSADRIAEVADYVRRSITRGDYREAVRSGSVEPWERAFLHVVRLQDFLRDLGGFLADGTPRNGMLVEERAVGPVNAESLARTPVKVFAPVAPEESPVKPTELLIRHADVAGYVYDPSWVNGGIASYAPDRGIDPIGVRVKAVQGIAAFRSVEKMGGIPELAWFYCGADFELGVSSWFEGVTGMMLLGGTPGESNGASPRGPGELARMAAAEHRRILGSISRLPHRHERGLRISYTDGRCPRQLVTDYELGTALLVWRAQQEAGEAHERGHYVAPGQGTLERLVAMVRADWPTFEGSVEGLDEELTVRIRRAAELVLWTAHERYRVECLPPGPSPLERVHIAMANAKRSAFLNGGPPDAPRPRRRRKPRVRPDIVSKGVVGRLKRQLAEVYEVKVPESAEPRAA